LLIAIIATAACRQDMHDQPRYKAFAQSTFFADGRAVRPHVADTVARGQLQDDSVLYTGKVGAAFSDVLPMPLDRALLERGKQRYEIYCTPCHGQTGAGDGMIVQRGFRKAASFHTDRLRAQPVGYLFDVMTNGFGVMPDYSFQVKVEDRWAIAAYVRVLQQSQHARLADVPAAERALLEHPAAAARSGGPEGEQHHP
jgi:mono/diheme cytochrome c family protein